MISSGAGSPTVFFLRPRGCSGGTLLRCTMGRFRFRPHLQLAELQSLASKAGLRDIQAKVYHPAFRIALTGRV